MAIIGPNYGWRICDGILYVINHPRHTDQSTHFNALLIAEIPWTDNYSSRRTKTIAGSGVPPDKWVGRRPATGPNYSFLEVVVGGEGSPPQLVLRLISFFNERTFEAVRRLRKDAGVL